MDINKLRELKDEFLDALYLYAEKKTDDKQITELYESFIRALSMFDYWYNHKKTGVKK